jgi:hypothetical protein
MLRGTPEVHGKPTANIQMHFQFVTLVGAVGIELTSEALKVRQDVLGSKQLLKFYVPIPEEFWCQFWCQLVCYIGTIAGTS